MHRLLKTRAGFTLAEITVAMVLTAVIGAAITGVFVTQAKFFDTQEKVAFARGVARGGMNMIISELRMLEQGGGLLSATNRRLTVRAPYAMAIVCGNTMQVTVSRLPVDSIALNDAGYAGYAYRKADGTFGYVDSTVRPTRDAGIAVCLGANITIMSGASFNQTGHAEQFGGGVPFPAPAIGSTVFLYQKITYEFKESGGRTGLWRRVDSAANPVDEELVAPFDSTAKFRFYVNDSPTAGTAVPPDLKTVTGIELTLDGLSERPLRDGSRQRVPLTTSVFFKNRP